MKYTFRKGDKVVVHSNGSTVSGWLTCDYTDVDKDYSVLVWIPSADEYQEYKAKELDK